MVLKDYCNNAGAECIKEKIINVWANDGLGVDIMLIKAGFTPALRSARTDVRSDMINGLPRSMLSSNIKKKFLNKRNHK